MKEQPPPCEFKLAQFYYPCCLEVGLPAVEFISIIGAGNVGAADA